MKRLGILTAALVLLGLNAAAQPSKAETILVKPSGEYATVETKPTKDIMSQLQRGTAEQQKAAIAELQAHPDKYAPPALCLLSAALVEEGKMDEAAFWFYAGQLRSRADGELCRDISARAGTGVLTSEFGPPINKYMFQHVEDLKKLVPKVVDWDRTTGHNYDRRWIALHGMGAFAFDETKKNESLIEPKAKWNESDEMVRTRYLAQFNDAMKQLAEKQK